MERDKLADANQRYRSATWEIQRLDEQIKYHDAEASRYRAIREKQKRKRERAEVTVNKLIG